MQPQDQEDQYLGNAHMLETESSDNYWYIQDTMSDSEKELLELNDQGKFEELYERCTQILQNDSESALGLGYITDALIGLEKFEEANEYCNQFLELYSSNVNIETNQSIALNALKNNPYQN